MMNNVLDMRHVSIRDDTRGVAVVNDLNLTLERGEVVGIVGESGSGKSISCRAALGILPRGFSVSTGSVSLFGENIDGLGPREWRSLRGSRISAVFQDSASFLNPSLRVGTQIDEILRATGGLPRSAARQRRLELFDAVHLADPAHVSVKYPHELSGGMAQRVLIAAAIALEPEILIADEATTALDVTVQAEILDLLRELRESVNLSMIFVSHDLAVVSQVCDRVLVFKDGSVVESGRIDDVLRRPTHAYTRYLIDEHARFGLERYLASPEEAIA